MPLEPTITGVEYSPQLAQVAGASDMMIVARFLLVMGDHEHPLSLCLSFPGLLPFLKVADSVDNVSDRDRARRQEARTRLTAGLQEIPVDVSVRFRATGADPMELAGLQVGDVVRLAAPLPGPSRRDRRRRRLRPCHPRAARSATRRPRRRALEPGELMTSAQVPTGETWLQGAGGQRRPRRRRRGAAAALRPAAHRR